MQKNSKQQPSEKTEPGVFVNVLDHGVLITGQSGIGKSEVALVLVRNGHQLIADDSVIFFLDQQSRVIGKCPDLLQNLLEIRGLGIIDIKELFGGKAICNKKPLELIIKLHRLKGSDVSKIDRINGIYHEKILLGQSFTEITLPVEPGRNMAVLIEVAVRNHILRNNGYNAADILKKRQHEVLTADER